MTGSGMSMKKFSLILMMIFTFAGFASAAKAANVVLSGTVAATFSVTITPTAISGQLVITDPVITSNLIIAAAEFATNKNSWTLGVYSLNGSKLMGSTGESLPYTFSLGDIVGMQNLTLGTSITPVTKVMTGKNPSLIQDLKITYTGNPLLQEGIYTDTIYFIIGGD
jgi:hypothetical protein